MTVKFGTDGVRGVANAELTPEKAYALGRTGAAVLKQALPDGRSLRMLVGRDTRLSGDLLFSALAAGILSTGVSVLDVGIATTPAVSWLTRREQVMAGVMISASHNAMQDNGIKFFSHTGSKIADHTEREIERLVASDDDLPRPIGQFVGRIMRAEHLLDSYVNYLAELPDLNLSGLRLAIDCANGAAAAIAMHPFRRLGADVRLLHCQPDGCNINERCGSTHPESLQEYVVAENMDFGLALDGDADRCLAVDAAGRLLDGDQIIALMAVALRRQGRLAKDTVVATIVSNLGLEKSLAGEGIQVVRSAVGDKHVMEAMRAGNYILGGEASGHIIFAEHASTGDGLLTGLMLANHVRSSGTPLAELASVMVRLPQAQVNVEVRDKEQALKSPGFIAAKQRAEENLAGKGRVVVRPSGTEPLIRILVDAPSQPEADDAAEFLAATLRGLV